MNALLTNKMMETGKREVTLKLRPPFKIFIDAVRSRLVPSSF